MPRKLSYKDAGVDIDAADKLKENIAESVDGGHALVLNKLGAFASLIDASFPDYEHPVLVCKMEEPGSKQLIAIEHGRIEGICQDLVHHLFNDICVTGAQPLFVQDLIVCSKLEPAIIKRIVAGIAAACRAHGAALTGGETSEQPGLVAEGRYVLGASGIGVVEKAMVIDGSRIQEGDLVIAAASDGLHTNGYSLVRKLIAQKPELLKTMVGGASFLDAILRPHLCYYPLIRNLFGNPGLTGLAHITGGGLPGNLCRILPDDLEAEVEAHTLRILPVFRFIREHGNVDEAEMLRTFNLGVGLTLVTRPDATSAIIGHLKNRGCDAYEIGNIVKGRKQVQMKGALQWE